MTTILDSWQDQPEEMDIARTAASSGSSSGFFAVVLLREGQENQQAKVLLPSSQYRSLDDYGERVVVETAADLGRAARARAEKKLRREVDKVVLVYADNPTTTTTHDLHYNEEYDLKPPLQRKALAGEDELGVGNLERVDEYYVIVTLPTIPMQIAPQATVPPDRDNKRPRRVAEFTFEELDARIKQRVGELLAKAKHPIGSVMIASQDLLTIAKVRGANVATNLREVGIQRKPAAQTVKLTLNEKHYYLGFCSLKSEKLLVQPLLTQLLDKLVAPYKYTAFDVHNKQTHLFDGGMPDNLLVRNEYKPIMCDDAAEDLVDASRHVSSGLAQQEEEEKELYDSNGPEEIEDLAPDYLKQQGITPDTIGLIVEGKPMDKVDDPDSHLQLLKCMRGFLLAHPLRQHITGMLTDLQVAYFYMLGRDKTGPRSPNDYHPAAPQMHGDHVQFLGKFTGADILQVLQSMLSGEGNILDDTPFFVQREGNDESLHVEFVQRLGRGGFGRVLHVKVGDKDFALKMPYRYQPIPNYNIERELEATLKVAGQCKNVPLWMEKVQAVGKNYDSLLLMTPVGVPHSRRQWTKPLFLDLLDGYHDLCQQLRGSGSAVVHRDIGPSNITLVSRDERYAERLVLIDWGCAIEERGWTTYAGSRAYAAHRLYDLKATDPEFATPYWASCVDDYGSFLLTAASAFFMRDGMAECCHGFRSKSIDIYSMRAADWLQFWQDRLPAAWWETYVSLSSGINANTAHETLRAFLDRHLPATTLGF